MKMDVVQSLPRVPAGARYHPERDSIIQVTLEVCECPPEWERVARGAPFHFGPSFPGSILPWSSAGMAGRHGGRAESLPEQEEHSVLPALFSTSKKKIFAFETEKTLLQMPLARCGAKRFRLPSSSPWDAPGWLLPKKTGGIQTF